ncbi:metallophosphoesterase, partial [Hyphomonas sp.]|uniref:metallophosphoesterase family protein n=1 Tax=Hyphomonas sp. TaxID=87 RepID=UPI00391D7B19
IGAATARAAVAAGWNVALFARSADKLSVLSDELGDKALVVSGDLTQRGSRNEFRKAREWIDSLNLPAIVVPGNHDTPLLHAAHRVLRPFNRYREYFGDLTRPLDAGAVRLLPLNTSRGWQTRANWAEGSVNLGHLDEMISQAETEEKIPILVCHHPFTPFAGAGLRTRTRRGDAASARLAESRIQLLMTGHVHTPHVERIQSPSGQYMAVSAGTLSLRLRASPPGFNVIDVDMSGMTVVPFSFEEDAFSALPGQRFEWTSTEPAASGMD